MSKAEEKLNRFIYAELRELEKQFGARTTGAITGALVVTELSQTLIKAGYLPVEPVQLEVLSDEEMLKAIPTWIAYQGKAITSRDRQIAQDTIAHNEAKGQLYRRVE